MEPDDVEALTATNSSFESIIERADKLIEQMNRPPKEVSSVGESQTAAQRLAAAQSKLEALVVDPTSSQAERTRAMVVRDRASLAVKKEGDQTALYGAMGRSMALRADEAAARDAAERQAQRERAEFEEKEKIEKWGHAMRQRYVNGGR